MKTFIILYYLGQMGGVIGPVPYDMTKCEDRAIDRSGFDPNILVYKCEARQNVRRALKHLN